MQLNLLKNPIFWGILIAVLVYLYLYWTAMKTPNKSVNIIIPAVAGILVWFLTSMIFDYSSKTVITPQVNEVKINNPIENQTAGSESYYIVGKNNIRLPATDVFIDLAKF